MSTAICRATGAAIIAASIMGLVSCTQEKFGPESLEGGLSFSPSVVSFNEGPLTKAGVSSLETDCPLDIQLYEKTDGFPESGLFKENDEETDTKGAQVTSMYSQFIAWGYKYTGTWDNSTTPYFANYTFSPYGDYYMRSSGTSPLWSTSSYNMRFYAYAPTSVSGTFSTSGSSAGAPVLTHAPNTTVSSQTDLVAAASTEYAGNYNEPVSLNFEHVLSGIQFKVGDYLTSMTVTSIAVKGIYTKGRYTIGSSSWDVATDNTTGNYTVSSSVTVNGTSGETIYDGSNTILVIPQTCPSGAYIEFKFSISGQGNFTGTADISGKTFQKGKIHTFYLSLENTGWVYDFRLDQPAAVSYSGGNSSMRVYSSKCHLMGFYQPLPWTAEFSDDDGATWSTTKPSWVTSFPASGNGESNQSGTSYTATIAAQTNNPTSVVSWDPAARYNTYRGSAGSPIDLSKEDIFGDANAGNRMTTANTYVVHAPGMYMLPCVYGNAVTDGADNATAYSMSSAFNAYDVAPSSPYIETDLAANSHTLTDAVLCWSEVDGLVSVNSSLETHNGIKYLVFEVPAASINCGNALVAVRDENSDIVWSWQIWCTSSELEDVTITNYQGVDIDILNENVGQVNGGTYYSPCYAGRTCKFRLTQSQTDTQIQGTITQNEYKTQQSISTQASYYQWGRKDPHARTSTTYYDNSSYAWQISSSNTQASYGTSIKNPFIFYKGYSNWCSSTYYNSWDVNSTGSTDRVVTKTIYDPSPAGYCVSRYNAFTGFTSNGGSQSTASNFNVIDITGDGVINSYDFNKGWYFKANSSDTEGVFFSACGFRFTNNGSLDYVGSRGNYWLSVATNASNGCYLSFSNSIVGPQYNSGRASGFVVRSSRIQ